MTKAHTLKLMTMPSDCQSVSQSDGHIENKKEIENKKCLQKAFLLNVD